MRLYFIINQSFKITGYDENHPLLEYLTDTDLKKKLFEQDKSDYSGIIPMKDDPFFTQKKI